MTQDFYAQIAPIYDRMIRWERRLKLEAPLFEALWRSTGAARVLDAACGSGRHLLLFKSQGLQAAGSDASETMLELARERLSALPQAERPPLFRADWAELEERVPGTYDMVLCLGNSLPYVTDREELGRSLRGLWSRVAPGGGLLIQFRNFGRMRGEGERFLPLSSGVDAATGAEVVCVRQYEWHDETVDFIVILLSRDRPGAEWTLRHWTTPLATYRAADAAQPLEALGARVTLHGSLALEPFDPKTSGDVVILARRG